MLIDISHTLKNGTTPYPEDPSFELTQIAFFNNNGYNNYLIRCGMHIGTHIDGIAHLTASEEAMSEAPLDRFYGDTIILNYLGSTSINYTSDLELIDIKNKIVLFYTGHDKYWGKETYFQNHPIISERIAQWLVDNQVKMIGIDFPSPDIAPYTIHKTLLSNRIHILENLTNLQPLLGKSNLTLMAFPLKINADSSLVRAVVFIPDTL